MPRNVAPSTKVMLRNKIALFVCPFVADKTASPQRKLLTRRMSVSTRINGISKISCPDGPPKVFVRRTANDANKPANIKRSVIRYVQNPKYVLSATASSIIATSMPFQRIEFVCRQGIFRVLVKCSDNEACDNSDQANKGKEVHIPDHREAKEERECRYIYP